MKLPGSCLLAATEADEVAVLECAHVVDALTVDPGAIPASRVVNGPAAVAQAMNDAVDAADRRLVQMEIGIVIAADHGPALHFKARELVRAWYQPRHEEKLQYGTAPLASHRSTLAQWCVSEKAVITACGEAGCGRRCGPASSGHAYRARRAASGSAAQWARCAITPSCRDWHGA